MRAAGSPTGSGRIGVVGPVMAVLLGALGFLLLRDALVAGSGSDWLPAATKPLVGLRPAGWMVAAGVVLALVGLWLLVTALRRRSRDTLALATATGAHLRTADVARRASAAALDVGGVLSARSTATRRRVTCTVTTTGDDSIAAAVSTTVARALARLARPPRVTVRATSAHPKDRSS